MLNRRFITLLISFLSAVQIFGQEAYSIYEDQWLNHYERYVYAKKARFHTSVRPYLLRQVDTLVNTDSLYQIAVNKKWKDIVLNRSMVKLNKEELFFTIDPLFQFEYGKDEDQTGKSWINTRGIMVNARLGKKVAVTTLFRETQSLFNDYRHDRVQDIGVIPGQGRPKSFETDGYDYGIAEGTVTYQPDHHFTFTLGHGKNFFGDGYRSMMLSDNSFNYPYFRITTDFWHIKYVNLWAQFQDLTVPHNYGIPYDKKWGSFHYLSWTATTWLSIGFFEAIIWQNADTSGYRGFDVNYANPVIFTRPVEFSVGSSDNALMGISGKITLWQKQVFYGQMVIDEFKMSDIKAGIKHELNPSDTTILWGSWTNKWAFQAGYKTFDIFNIEHLDLQAEFNYVRPYTYSHTITRQNYGHYNQSLAHPLGSNFWETVLIGRYNYKRLFLEAKYSFALHAKDTAGLNFGSDIYKDYDTHFQAYHNEIAQGEQIRLKNLNLTAAFLVNPRTNFNVYLGYIRRSEETLGKTYNQNLVVFGIRTSLHNVYWDF